jgi:hypothetical protein
LADDVESRTVGRILSNTGGWKQTPVARVSLDWGKMSQSLLLLYLHTFLVRCFSSGFFRLSGFVSFFFSFSSLGFCFRVSGLGFWCFVIFPSFLFLFRILYDSLFYYPYQAFGGFGVRGVCIVQDVDHLSWYGWKALYWLFCFWEGRVCVLSFTLPNVHYCDF